MHPPIVLPSAATPSTPDSGSVGERLRRWRHHRRAQLRVERPETGGQTSQAGFADVGRSPLDGRSLDVARLAAAEEERRRIARDLHDLLGPSLTAIAVKAALAQRLTDRDMARASREIADVEQLSREALASVRAAVASYRHMTLASELDACREVLRAAGVAAQTPDSAHLVDPANRPLFGWVLREAVTNVVRHAHATTCTITMGPNWIDVSDDGAGQCADDARPGTGLLGLSERVAAAGGVMSAGSLLPRGWRLRAEVPATR